ncbi:hypothetical protein GHT06_019757 [Daphnia sinensis]|uniref:Uncharacterized protein n=1 Tax=Daphnia sinensis TaxID=1820382 RepID=A0AAD5L2F2_9CRUS|nr:hypothetical protein GHT06_019757 [Daphnia sinensis]
MCINTNGALISASIYGAAHLNIGSLIYCPRSTQPSNYRNPNKQSLLHSLVHILYAQYK